MEFIINKPINNENTFNINNKHHRQVSNKAEK